MTSAATPQPPAGCDDLVAGFLASVFDTDRIRALAEPAAEPGWQGETTRLLAAAGPAYWRRREAREHRLADNLAKVASTVTAKSLPAFASARIAVAPVPDLTTTGDVDLSYVKINHGFWEHLYWLFAPHDESRMRGNNPDGYRTRYVASGFLDGLAAALAVTAEPDADLLRFPGMHLAVSLASGTHDHADVIAGFGARTAAEQKIVVGAAIGLTAWWETLFPGRRPTFHDGSFPKRGLATGALRQTLQWAAARSERIVFVVPPHLAGVRLADASLPQETVTVPADTVHESWAGCLRAVTAHVLGRVAGDGRVLVITQSAVFSALLGLFLNHAKRQLLPVESRLRFFDVGQALDVASPTAGSGWARRYATGDLGLFHVPRH